MFPRVSLIFLSSQFIQFQRIHHQYIYTTTSQPAFFLLCFRVLLPNDNVSDSSDSHAYYSKVPKEELQSLDPQRPPPLKEHLYQNFDQVFLEQQRHHHLPQHPDLLNTSSKGINDGFYENTRSRSNPPEEGANTVVIVNDEK